MGLGISHSGGPIGCDGVQRVLAYFEDRLKKDDFKQVADWRDHMPSERIYWKIHGPISEIEKSTFDKFRSIEASWVDKGLKEAKENLKAARPEQRAGVQGRVARLEKKRLRTKLVVPQDFQPTMQEGVIANMDPRADSLALIFTQNGTLDEWRELGEYTKTSHIDPWPGAHVTICEILLDVQRIVKAAGGDFEIEDECEYCDDYRERRAT